MAAVPRTALGGAQKSVYFKMSVPASFQMNKSYKVWAECMVARLTGGHPFITKILSGGCECPLGSSVQCVHVLMLMLVVHQLPRPHNLGGAGNVPSTSVLCAWADPGQGDLYDVTTPLSKIPFIRIRMKQRTRNARRLLQVADTSGWRYQFESLADKDSETLLSSRNDPRRVAARWAVWRAVSQASGGKSAAETAFACLDPEVPQDPYIPQSDSSISESIWETASTTSTECSGGGWTSSDVSGSDDSD
jgi:hypothetical protein